MFNKFIKKVKVEDLTKKRKTFLGLIKLRKNETLLDLTKEEIIKQAEILFIIYFVAGGITQFIIDTILNYH